MEDATHQSSDWIAVTDSATLIDRRAMEVVVHGNVIALFADGGHLYAMDGMCAHQGGPIAKGVVQHGCVTCPWHGWQYELATGIQTINRQPLQRTFSIRERDGKIEIRLPNPTE